MAIKISGSSGVTFPDGVTQNIGIDAHRHPFRNKLINGNFDVWQRGTSQTSSGYGSDDRWVNEHSGSTKTHSQQSFPLGSTEVPNNPKFYSRTVVTSAAGVGNYCRKLQNLEGVRTISGKTVTVSFYARADAAKPIAIEFAQVFGSGGTPSAAVVGIGAQQIILSTSFTKYIVKIDVPSVSGKTLGTNGDDYIELNFWFDAGSNHNVRSANLGQQSGTFDIAQVQLEEGAIATEFEDRPIGLERSLCQRYFEIVSMDAGGAIAIKYASAAAAGYHNSSNSFAATKRAAPSITLSGTVTYTNASGIEFVASPSGVATRVTTGAAGVYRAYGPSLLCSAEL